jgi:hypothetical protein
MPAQSANEPQFIELAEWAKGGINQSTRRSTIGDEDLWWLENYFPLATGELRTAWGPSAPIYTAPPGLTICRIFFACLDGTNVYCYNFMSDGTIRAVNVATGAVTNVFGAGWGPTTPPYYADLKVWEITQVGNTTGQIGGLLIGSPLGYYAVDAAFNVSGPGANAPSWLTGGALDPSGNPFPMPSGLPGIYAMEVYNQRVWVQGQTVISFSAPTNGADFSASGGGGSFPYNGDQLTVTYTDLYATAGFLYVFGDSMTDWISNIQLVGSTSTPNITSPYTTEFQLSNYNPQIGQRFPRPVGAWLQALTVYDKAGAYLIDGSGQTTWLTQKVNNLWDTINPTTPIPTCCPVHVFGQRWLLFNGTYTDPWGVARNLILAWNGQIWTACSQRYNLTNINFWEQNSCIDAYGTDGNVLVKLFAQPDPALVKRLATKAYAGKNPLMIKNFKRVFVHMHDMAGQPEGSFLNGSLSTAGGGIPNGSQQLSFEVQPNQDDMRPSPSEGQGLFAWLDLWGNSPDYIIERILLAYEDRTLFGA